ncbi:MAG TPA: cytochrome c [Saprospiraceae bacterium]|nr:cytochrome c [Saprospiraceae bacterium]
MSPGKFLLSFYFLLSCMICMSQSYTYEQDIKPILQKNCVSCHRQDEAGAMPLDTYENVAAYGRMIQYATSAHLMPPWYADPSYRHFLNERVLTDDDIQKIKDWVTNDMPEGKHSEEKISVNKNIIRSKREPDLVIPMREAFEQYEMYADQYQVFVLPTEFDEDQWIEGIEFVPGNKKIVRSAVISVEQSDKFDVLDTWDPRYGYYSFGGLGNVPDQPFWYTWSLQQEATFYPEGLAKFLPAKSKLLLHIQYGPKGRPQKDSSFVRLYFSKNKIPTQIFTFPLINPYTLTGDSLFIPKDTKKIFHASYRLPYSLTLLSITPQANLICRAWEAYALLPGNNIPVKLLKIKDWNFNWKLTYRFESPITLPQGTIIHALVSYDNTTDNFCNPSDQPIPVTWGAHLFRELLFLHFECTIGTISNAPVQLMAPVTVSDSIMSIKLDVNVVGEYEIEACTGELNCISLKKLSLDSGKYSLDLPLDNLPEGNYLLRIRNDKAKVVAQQTFLKMTGNKI